MPSEDAAAHMMLPSNGKFCYIS